MDNGWKITILDIVAVITIPLIGIIGYMMIDRQSEMAQTQKAIASGQIVLIREVSKLSAYFIAIDNRVSNLEIGQKEHSALINTNIRHIDQLKGAR